MTVEKLKQNQLLRPITTGTNSSMNHSLEAREKSRVHGAIGFGFASHWLKNWRDSFKPITKRSNRNHVITFDGHLKTALMLWKTQSFLVKKHLNLFFKEREGCRAGDLRTKSIKNFGH